MIRITQYIFVLLLVFGCSTNNSEEYLESNFKNPPASCKPKTWMHALSGNMSKEGFTKDLEAIAEVGLGGVLLFNVSANIPAGNIKYNSPEHHEMLKHAAQECERLGLTFGFHNCDGWSSSGGPWITPENSMKVVVWSETLVKGGEVNALLDQPFTRKGYYEDIAVLAYPSFPSEVADAQSKPHVTSSDISLDLSKLTDGNPDNEIFLSGDQPWIQFDYGNGHTLQSSFMTVKERRTSAKLLSSNDGKNFTLVKNLYVQKTAHAIDDYFDHFEPVKARYFRIEFNRSLTIKEVRLMSTYTLGDLLPRTGINRIDDYKLSPIGKPTKEMLIQPESIINLTEQMNDNGQLQANLPEGTYTILRMGYTTNGLENAPSSLEGRGLECDKFSKKAIESHYKAFITKAVQNLKGIEAMQYIEIDSYEMAMQNWTDNLDSIFKAKKGYDIIPFLPLFAGRFVESPESSDAVLSDFRQVTCDLTTENYYGNFSELCHRDGLYTYFEPYGDGLINELDVAAKADINMGEFWPWRPVRMMEAAVSGSHIYGKNIISAESFTSVPTVNWKGHPAMIKQKGDSAWVDGVNQFMLHRYAHQANTHVKPGMTLDRWGFHFDRTNTWWYNAGAEWFKYMARGSFLLRQGIPVSDMLVFIGEGAPNAPFYRDDFTPHIPQEINFDCINADGLINRIQVKGNSLVLPDGITYRILVLKNCEKLSLAALEKVHEIALAGIPIVGLSDIMPQGYDVSEALKLQFVKLVSEIKSKAKLYSHYNWSDIMEDNHIKPDLVVDGPKTVGYSHRRSGDTDIYFFYNRENKAKSFTCHFRVDGKNPELWNPINGQIKKLGQFKHQDGITSTTFNLDAEESVFVVFRTSSEGVVSIVKAEKGSSSTEYLLDDKNQLIIKDSQNSSYQVVTSDGYVQNNTIADLPNAIELTGAWEVEFRAQDNYAAIHTFNELSDWKDHSIADIKYYSGAAIYRKSFAIENGMMTEGDAFILDLGNVKVVASVKVNGEPVGIDWMPPFKLDVTSYLKAGENQLEVEITNQWSNRLIGDEHLVATDGYDKKADKMPQWYVNNEPMPTSERTTFCTAQFYNKKSPLQSSGLLGPVRIYPKRTIEL